MDKPDSWFYTGVLFIQGSFYAGSIQESGLSWVQFMQALYKSLVYPWFSLSWFYTGVWFIHGSVYAGFIQESGLSMVQFKLVLYEKPDTCIKPA
jgi:hypothetical protein